MPVIAIARQQASLGHSIGRALAKQLSCRVIDTSTVGEFAEAYGISLPLRGPELEEHQPTIIERIRDERSRYRSALIGVITNAALDQNAVIVGLASTSILQEIDHVVKVAVIASDKARARRVIDRQERTGIADEEALLRTLHASDRQRKNYHKFLFGADWLDPVTNDITINTSRARAETGVELVQQLVQDPEFQPSATSLARLEEMALASRIEAVLVGEPGLVVSRAIVDITPTEVCVKAEVVTDEDRARVDEIVRSFAGNRRVVSQVTVHLFASLETV